MSDDRLRDAIETFLADYDTAMGEYEQGYVDADATLSTVDSHVTALRTAAEAAETAETSADAEDGSGSEE